MKIKESYVSLRVAYQKLHLFEGWGCILEVTYLTLPLSEAETVLKLWTPMSDQDRISPHCNYTISCRQVMRMTKKIKYGISNWFNTKFSKLT